MTRLASMVNGRESLAFLDRNLIMKMSPNDCGLLNMGMVPVYSIESKAFKAQWVLHTFNAKLYA